MRLPGRIAAAIAVLAEVEARRRPVAEALKAWGLANRFAGAGDRAAIGNLVYDALRRRSSHAWAMGGETPRGLVLSVVVREWGETPQALAGLFSGDAHAPAALTEEEVARLEAADPLAGAPEHVRADMPEWVAPALREAWGETWVAEAQALAGRPPLDLRVNTLKAGRDKVLKELRRFAPLEGPVAPDGIRIPAGTRDSRTPNVLVEEGYRKGWFEVQDQGSQAVAELAGARAGEQVLDLCAGAGGKALAMAAAMRNKGQIFAHDSDRVRLAPIYDRLRRAGVRNVQVRAPAPGALDDLVGRMDRVVIDAPCTGSGTWRRRPDAKWKLTAEQVAARVAEQKAILEDGARYVKPGGVLVYITCSVLPEENGLQAAGFLAAHPEFSIVPGHSLWHGRFSGSPARARFSPEGGVALTPHTTGTDGFYLFAAARSG
ncbi:RsmB/NOP family class I SAM-dependent RNA methyltransferase [Devosia sp.]|uniref:RsmB/NOP family class I SAM-dependent RNA methyltransferase n=1 Tax=Devosia sp. TaxID=1871048 RepID=UPI002F1BA3FA